MCALIHTQASGTSAHPMRRSPERRRSSIHTWITMKSAASISGRTIERCREAIAHQSRATNGASPLAPSRRATTQPRPNVPSVSSQRQAISPHSPPNCQNGQSSARKSHDGSR